MASAPPPSPPDVELSPPVLVSMISSSDTEEENVNQGFESGRGFANHGVVNRGGFSSRGSVSELSVSCFGLVMSLWFLVSMFLILGVYRPQHVWLGPNSSILFEPDSIFLQSVKVKELGDSKSGLELFGFCRTPPLDVYVNWSESRLLSVSYNSYKELHYYFNRGTSLNITYTVKPQGSSVQLVLMEGMQGISRSSLNDNAFRNTAWSWNLIQGSGKIEFEISQSSSYYVAVVNLKRKDVEVELDIDVRAVLYDTKQSSYKCTLSNGECTFNALSLVGSSAVLTSPSPSLGASIEEEDVWYIRFSYQPRWTAYVITSGIVMCFMLVAIHIWERLQCFGGERYLTDNASVRTRLLANKDDDGSSMGSCNESFANDDADLEEFTGKDGEASNCSRRLCGICFNAPRDCFFLPCGHCVSCYRCGKTIAEGMGSCPICRRTTKKVKRIYTA